MNSNLIQSTKKVIAAVLALLVIGIICHLPTVEAQDDDEPEVKYCQDLTTGEVTVVEAGMPCPYPTAEM